MAGSELKTTGVDTAEVPSAEWGWSGEAPRFFRFMGWLVTLVLLAMLIGNHQGNLENYVLLGFAALLVTILVRDIVRRRRPR